MLKNQVRKRLRTASEVCPGWIQALSRGTAQVSPCTQQEPLDSDSERRVGTCQTPTDQLS